MRVRKVIFTATTALASVVLPAQLLQAQDDCGDECKINTNLAVVLNVPVPPHRPGSWHGMGNRRRRRLQL
jgi:hypothetical protein